MRTYVLAEVRARLNYDELVDDASRPPYLVMCDIQWCGPRSCIDGGVYGNVCGTRINRCKSGFGFRVPTLGPDNRPVNADAKGLGPVWIQCVLWAFKRKWLHLESECSSSNWGVRCS